MKKTLLAAAILALAGSAFALDVSVVGGTDYVGQDRGFGGVTVGQKYDKLGVTAGFERTNVGQSQNRYNLTGSYDVMKLGSVTVVGKVGVAYLDNNAVTGWATQVGAGAVIPLTGKFAATVDYRYQAGQTRVSKFDGNVLMAGIQYSF